jgi:alanine racemase
VHRPNALTVDASAVSKNVEAIIRSVGPGTRLIAAMKADGYGFGLIPLSRTVMTAGAWAVAVADPADAERLRSAGHNAPILMYSGTLFDQDLVATIERLNLMPTVVDEQSLGRLLTFSSQPISAWIEVDVGLERLGIAPEALPAIVRRASASDWLRVQGVYAHVHVPDGPGVEAYVQWQLDRLMKALDRCQMEGYAPGLRMAASSAVLRLRSNVALDAVDPGHILYGLVPSGPATIRYPLRPALKTLTSTLIHIKVVRSGEYEDRLPAGLKPGGRIGIIPIGLSDGMPRFAAHEVLVHGRRCAILGYPSLEHTRIDLDAVPEASLGDEVTILGRQGDDEISFAEVMAARGLRGQAEVPLAVGKSVARNYVGE